MFTVLIVCYCFSYHINDNTIILAVLSSPIGTIM